MDQTEACLQSDPVRRPTVHQLLKLILLHAPEMAQNPIVHAMHLAHVPDYVLPAPQAVHHLPSVAPVGIAPPVPVEPIRRALFAETAIQPGLRRGRPTRESSSSALPESLPASPHMTSAPPLHVKMDEPPRHMDVFHLLDSVPPPSMQPHQPPFLSSPAVQPLAAFDRPPAIPPKPVYPLPSSTISSPLISSAPALPYDSLSYGSLPSGGYASPMPHGAYASPIPSGPYVGNGSPSMNGSPMLQAPFVLPPHFPPPPAISPIFSPVRQVATTPNSTRESALQYELQRDESDLL